MSGSGAELAEVLRKVRAGHDVVPFMAEQLPASEVEFRPLPRGMLELIRASEEFRGIRPGSLPRG